MDNCFKDAYDQICQQHYLLKETQKMNAILIAIALLLVFLIILVGVLLVESSKQFREE